VKQLLAEVRKLKEQLTQVLACQGVEYVRDAPGGPELTMDNNLKNNIT